MLFGELAVYFVLSLVMTLAYPVKLATRETPDDVNSTAQKIKTTESKVGFEVEVAEGPIREIRPRAASIAGVAVEQKMTDTLAIRAAIVGKGVSLGLPIALIGASNAWNVSLGETEARADYAYLFVRPEIGYQEYALDDFRKQNEEKTGETIHLWSGGTSIGSGYRIPSESKFHFWVQSWIGYRVYSSYLSYRGVPGAVVGFDIGAEF